MAEFFFSSGQLGGVGAATRTLQQQQQQQQQQQIPEAFVEEVLEDQALPQPVAVAVQAAADAHVTHVAVKRPRVERIVDNHDDDVDVDDHDVDDDDDDDDDDEPAGNGHGGGGALAKRQFVDITEYLCLPQSDAAAKLGLPVSTLSKRWKEAARNRKWPYRKVTKLDKEISFLLKGVPQVGPHAGHMAPELEAQLGVLLRQRQDELKTVVIRL